MRYKIALIFLVAGSIVILTAVFASQLGLDRSPGWGSGRLILLIIGLIAYGISAFIYLPRKYSIPGNANKDRFKITRILSDTLGRKFLSPLIGVAFGILLCLGIAIYALWYSSAGRFPAFPQVCQRLHTTRRIFSARAVIPARTTKPRTGGAKKPIRLRGARQLTVSLGRFLL